MSFKSWSSGIKNPGKYKSDDKPAGTPAVAHPLPPPDKAPPAVDPADKS